MYTELKKLPIPSFAWFAILVLLVGGLHTFAEGAFWYDAAILLLAGVAKALDVKFEKVVAVVDEFTPDEPQAQGRSVVSLARHEVIGEVELSTGAKVLRWLVG